MDKDSISGSEASTQLSKRSWTHSRDETAAPNSESQPLEQGYSSSETSLSTKIVIAVDVLFFVFGSSDRPVRVKLQPYKKFEWKAVPASTGRASSGEEIRPRSHHSVRPSREELTLGPGGMLVLKGLASEESSSQSEQVANSPLQQQLQEIRSKKRVTRAKKSLLSRIRSSETLSRWMTAVGHSLSTPSSRIISVATLTILASMIARGQR
mmetsp:Transcript_6906/g.42153  ORF Transcript_6906/g.42153 Transcript_6906/m.42153 type:complete len:210 (-) Transcript_6906:1124-1753(-)